MIMNGTERQNKGKQEQNYKICKEREFCHFVVGNAQYENYTTHTEQNMII
jgi:hypothetical protein